MRQSVLNPSGAGQMFFTGTAAPNRADREAMYLGLNRAVPYDIRVDRMDSHGGWAATPADVLRFLFTVGRCSRPSDGESLPTCN